MKKSQTDRILNHLKQGRSLTPLSALMKFQTLALSQRIGELKKRGVRIESRMVNRNGKRVASYRLAA